jgi:very-short-patch-repair endonuclease
MKSKIIAFTQAGRSLPEIFNPDLTEPYYEPPYGSPLEGRFAWAFVKCLHPEALFQKQASVQTICGNFRLDFLVCKDSMRVGFECDGQDFHDPERDLWRDALVLSQQSVDQIVRLRGTDLYREMDDCLFVLSRWFPELFSERWHANLGAAASFDARQQIISCMQSERCQIDYRELLDEEDDSFILRPACSVEILRRFRMPKSGRPFWEPFVSYAKRKSGGNLDEIIRAHKEDSPR